MPAHIKKTICSRINKELINNVEKYVRHIDTTYNFSTYIFWFPLLERSEVLDFSKQDFQKFVQKILTLNNELSLEVKI